MSDQLVQRLIEALLTGGSSSATIALLVLVIGGLLWDRRRMLDVTRGKDEKIARLIDRYYAGSMALSEALTAIKHELAMITSHPSQTGDGSAHDTTRPDAIPVARLRRSDS